MFGRQTVSGSIPWSVLLFEIKEKINYFHKNVQVCNTSSHLNKKKSWKLHAYFIVICGNDEGKRRETYMYVIFTTIYSNDLEVCQSRT